MTETTKDVPLSATEIDALLRDALAPWSREGGVIRRIYKTQSWKATLMAVNAIGYLAETAWHHPDLLVSYARVEVRLSTHSAGGITAKDIALARRIEEIVAWRPGRGEALEGPPAEAAILARE